MKRIMTGYKQAKPVIHNWYISPNSQLYVIMRYMRSLGVLLNLIVVPVL